MDLRKELETENDKGTYVSLKVINGEELIIIAEDLNKLNIE
jgi:hypothetical protein